MQKFLYKRIFRLTFELFIFLILLEIGLRIGGLIFLSLQEHRNILSIRQKGSYRIMCLGESTTVGVGKYSYPSQLEEILNGRQLKIKFSVINKGIPGIDSSSILIQLEENLNKYKPDMVMTMMGANDGSKSLPYKSNSTSKTTPFFTHFRVYKLARLLWLDIVTRLKEVGILGPRDDGKLTGPIQAESSLKKSFEPNPRNDNAYVQLGRTYRKQGKYVQAEESFKKALEFNPRNDIAYLHLGAIYRSQGKYVQAEESFKKALELNPEDDKLYASLAVTYKEMGKYDSAQECYNKANALWLEYYNPITRQNYLKLKKILDKRGIKLVCVQYPVRSVEPLKKIFEGQTGVIFVDNEKIFKEALKKASCKDYFKDMFGGDFGHCTPEGNRLLAENIANVVLKEVLSK